MHLFRTLTPRDQTLPGTDRHPGVATLPQIQGLHDEVGTCASLQNVDGSQRGKLVH